MPRQRSSRNSKKSTKLRDLKAKGDAKGGGKSFSAIKITKPIDKPSPVIIP